MPFRLPAAVEPDRGVSGVVTRSYRLPATAAGIRRLRTAVARIAEDAGLGERVQDVQVALSEACGNVVVHAYPDAEGDMEVVAIVDDASLVLVVTDTGTGFVPGTRSPRSPRLGFGLPIIEQLADHVAVRTSRGRGTALTMRFTR
jgi:anti-sigma regulatory factor (Ser/Thr protein kinase)